jgi:hypothetical protein
MKTALPVLMLATLLCSCAPARTAQSGMPATYDDRHRISVTGEAVVNVAPDRILVTLGVDTRDKDLLIAKQQNDAIVKIALAAVKKLGVPDRDIQTDQVSINQRFVGGRSGEQVLDGYTVRNMFVVTLNDPAKVEVLISKALDAGVNYLLDVDFQTSELKKYREQARELAIKAAREKADKMAAMLGQTVGNPIQITEDQRYATPSYYSSWSGAGWGNRLSGSAGPSQNVSQVSAGEAADTLALGKVSIRASVSVIFELTR